MTNFEKWKQGLTPETFVNQNLSFPLSYECEKEDDCPAAKFCKNEPDLMCGEAFLKWAEGSGGVKFKFCGELTVIPEDETNFKNASSVCVIKCMKCGWFMFGDGGEQTPNYCAHCGVKFIDEVEE